MANPQPNDAHIILAHTIQDNLLLRDFSKIHLKVIYLVIRLSWGCASKGWQYKSYRDFEVIGLYKSDVAKVLTFLNSNNVITWNKKYNLLIFNKDFDTWTIPLKTDKKLFSDLIHNSLKNTNEVRNLLTILGVECLEITNGVSKKSERQKSDNTDISNVCTLPKESIKESNNIYRAFFEKIWSLYPNKKGKARVGYTQKKKLHTIGFEHLQRCIDRYKSSKEDWKAWQQGSTFFNSGYVDYLDENFEECKCDTDNLYTEE